VDGVPHRLVAARLALFQTWAPEAALETDTHLASAFSVEDEKHRVLLYGGRGLGFIHDLSLPALIESSR
jgi:hypothetical protein